MQVPVKGSQVCGALVVDPCFVGAYMLCYGLLRLKPRLKDFNDKLCDPCLSLFDRGMNDRCGCRRNSGRNMIRNARRNVTLLPHTHLCGIKSIALRCNRWLL